LPELKNLVKYLLLTAASVCVVFYINGNSVDNRNNSLSLIETEIYELTPKDDGPDRKLPDTFFIISTGYNSQSAPVRRTRSHVPENHAVFFPVKNVISGSTFETYSDNFKNIFYLHHNVLRLYMLCRIII